MDYFRKTQISLSAKRLLTIPEFQEQYSHGIQENPLLHANIQCQQYDTAVGQCVQEHGAQDPKCQQHMLVSTLCVGSVVERVKYLAWEQCRREKGEDWNQCQKELVDVVNSTPKAMEKIMGDLANPDSRDLDLLKKYNAQVALQASGGDDEFDRALGFAGQLACPAEWQSFQSCIDSNSGDYGAAPCKVPGKALAKCLGHKGTRLMLQRDAVAQKEGK